MNDIQILLDRWTEHSNPINLSLKSVYSCLLMNDGDISTTLAEFGLTTDDLVLADKEKQKRILHPLKAVDEHLVTITSAVEGFVLAAFYDDELDDEDHLRMLKDLRENVYDHYRSIKERLHQVVEIVSANQSQYQQ